MMFATQVCVDMLLVAFLPGSTTNPEAAAGFIDYGDLCKALGVLPAKDAELLRAVYDSRHA